MAKQAGRHGLEYGAPRIWRRHDGARGKAYSRAWCALVREYGRKDQGKVSVEPGSLLAMDLARCARAWVESLEAHRDLDDTRRAVERGGRGRSRAEIRRLEARALGADRLYQDAREGLARPSTR